MALFWGALKCEMFLGELRSICLTPARLHIDRNRWYSHAVIRSAYFSEISKRDTVDRPGIPEERTSAPPNVPTLERAENVIMLI